MKRLILAFVAMFSATMLCAQPNENVYWTARVKVKMDKKLEWEKKISVHLKTHYPQLKFRVYETLTGNNSGTYVVTTGPASFKSWDESPLVSPKGEAVRSADAQALDALCESVQVTYNRRQDDISNIDPNRKIKYLLSTSYQIDVGSWDGHKPYLAKVYDARKKGGSKFDITFFRPIGSGTNNAYLAVRFFEKWEDLDMDEKLRGLYEAAHGPESWTKDFPEYLKVIKSIESEIRVLRTDLSVM